MINRIAPSRFALSWFSAFALATLFIPTMSSAAENKRELFQSLDGLEKAIFHSSSAVMAPVSALSSASAGESAGFYAAKIRCIESIRSTSQRLTIAKNTQSPGTLYLLRSDLGELSKNLNMFALWVYLKGDGIQGPTEGALGQLNSAVSELDTAVFLYDLEVGKDLKTE